MSDNNPDQTGPPALDVTAVSIERGADLVLTVQLHNPMTRSAHYIAEVRGVAVDPATGRVEVRLTDEGRQVLPGVAFMLPRFNRVDPGGEALFSVHVPTSVVRLAPQVPAAPEVRFERHEIGPETQIDVVIGWSDTPFYPDPREANERHHGSVEVWELARSRVTFPARGQTAP